MVANWGITPREKAAKGEGDIEGRIHNTEAHNDNDNDDDSPDSSSTRVAADGNGAREGHWGERDVGGGVDQNAATEEYEELQKELSHLSRERSRDQSLSRVATNKSNKSGIQPSRVHTQRSMMSQETEGDQDDEKEEEIDFDLEDFVREGHFEKRTDGESAKKVGVVFKNLTVKGIGASAIYVKTLPDAVVGTFGPDLYHLACRFLPFLAFGRHGPVRTLINDYTGVVRDGEMMLVLGRPGAGCSTFLKAISNNREEFAQVTGDVSYGGIDAETVKQRYRGEVNYNPEDDVHFAELNVFQTFVFALLNKTKKREHARIPVVVDALLKMFGIPHTKYTRVGNEYVRGISGGERKRVSIAETLATKSTVLCWDNSTRGLDSSTALDYAKSLRIMTDVSRRTTLTTLYQAGEGIYEQMDKVLVIDNGRMVYQGPATEARQYFIDLGFEAPPRQTTADFLTACTDPNERKYRSGFEAKAPKSSEELEAAFRASPNYAKVLEEVAAYEKEIHESDFAHAKEFEQSVQDSKSSKTVQKTSPYTVSYYRQVINCAKREFWLIAGDRTTLYTKYFTIISNGLIVGSLFYNQTLETEGAFSRGGSLFFSILFLGWLQLAELMKAVSGRVVVARQRDYAFYRPSAVSLARVLVDFPILLPQVIIFGVIMYFMCNLDVDVSKFWIYMLFIYITTICITSLYRAFASVSPAIDDAVRFSGISLNILVIFTGYVIPKPQLTSKYIWFGWLYYINPLAYSFEAVVSNEFSGRQMTCSPEQLVPNGPGTDPAHQGCSLRGSPVDSTSVFGPDYLQTEFTYTRSHLWRNFGVLIAWSVLYILVTVFATEVFNFAKTGGGAIMFKKSKRSKNAVAAAVPTADEEKGGKSEDSRATSELTHTAEEKNDQMLSQITNSESVFTFENVEYTVPLATGGERQLLNKVNGFAKPGVMIALMGASGAGKTTLLNTLAQRQYMGVVGGEMLVDGRPLGMEFQRGTGFCEQMDLHDQTATIREALEFSAVLRQDRSIPRAEKIAYVDKVLDLLELTEIQDAVIMSLGVEQRKRLTIGVELAAKPSLLLFLDEPTSGLDSQSAYSIIRFLRKLTDAGQAILCTIHQPSTVLIEQFDMILALNPGGNTFYFGPVGENGSAVIKYFADRGFTCAPNRNIAEFILETAAKARRRADGTKVDWNSEWRHSKENKVLLKQIQDLKAERINVPARELASQHAFAAPVWTQTLELTKRVFRQHWRDPSYYYGKLFVSVIVGIFNGFTFYMLGNTMQDFQNRMFSIFMICVFPPTIVNAVLPKFFQNMMLWQFRELPSHIYGWFAFTTAQVVTEIPMAILTSVIYFCLWYYPAGLPYESSIAGYTFFMSMLFFLFQASWGQWIAAFAPTFTVIANVLPFFFVMFSLFNGIVRPYSMIPVFWRYWMYYVNPSTWWLRGVLSACLTNVPVICAEEETAKFTPPPGQTCQQYAGDFAARSGGYLVSPDNTTLCEYCAFSYGSGYLHTLNVGPNEKWRDLGIFCAFVFSNYALVYFFVYTRRVKHWSFGFGHITRWMGKGFDVIKSPFEKLFAKKEAPA